MNLISDLISHSKDLHQLQTKSSNPSNQINPNPFKFTLTSTPLNSLYLGNTLNQIDQDEDQIRLDDRSIWNQIKLKHDTVMGWVREVLDEEEIEEIDEDLMANNRKEALGLVPDEEEDEDLFEMDEMDLDDLEGLDESTENEDENGLDEEEEEKSVPYVTGLNDQEEDDLSESDSSGSDSTEPQSNQTKSNSSKDSSNNLSLQTLESRSSSSTKSSKTKRSKVDDHFFSLSEFEEETDQGELQMRRQLRKWSGEKGEPEDEADSEDSEEDVDLFSGFDTGIIPDDEEEDEEEEEEEDGNAMDLDTVANLRYNDFFDPPSRLPTQKQKQKQKEKQKPNENQIDKKTSNKKQADSETTVKLSKSPRVMFSEKVIVKEIPANNKGIRVSEISSGLDDEDEEDDDDDEEEGSIALDESETEGSEDSNESQSDQSESESESNPSEDPESSRMKRVSTDLFDDGFSDTSDQDSTQPSSESLSKHAKKLKLLSQQIAELEAENVAKKDWTLKGEATARDRPQNSLLEEDLEFEHIQKIAPAITEEKTLGLEALIKQRILDGQFDDVIRRRPIDLKAFLPSRLIELQDTKSNRSLAETYEDEYRDQKKKEETGERVINKKDEALEKVHQEIREMYEDLCGKLDALSNAHFTPKAPKTSIKTINNLPTIALESVLPVSVGSGTLLAPEELYSVKPKEIQMDRTELSHVQKQTQRRQRKTERKQNAKRIEEVRGKEMKSKEEKEMGKMSVKEQKEKSLKALSTLEGVTIIGKRSMGGEERPKKSRKLQNGSGLKL
ncbi:Mpp10 protein-domain-containing protein [Melampsora americana]|nr:Mpp10 protein-domain-containing protein [Melampsora americana]